ncbi:autotransporter assembly complex protein TamA [Cardiobacteriaceae bacterium TAE3-ERU3]|nr:autotransporter assembly complex protein TamA [Cardiobacteriaceae bacterium TAE3-ERU3]
MTKHNTALYLSLFPVFVVGCGGQLPNLSSQDAQPDTAAAASQSSQNVERIELKKGNPLENLQFAEDDQSNTGGDVGSHKTVEENDVLDGKTVSDIKISGIENEEQLNNARVFLTLEKLKDKEVDRPNYVAYLIENGQKEIATSQQPFGYYNVDVSVEKHFEGNNLIVSYDVRLNDPVHIDKVSVKLEGQAMGDAKFAELLQDNPLKSGDQLNHLIYERYKSRFEALAGARGYFESQFERSVVYVNPETNKADIELVYDSGPRYRFGDVDFSEVPLDEDLLERFVGFKAGEPYISRDVAVLQQDLQGSGYFQQVLVGNKPDTATKTVPVEAKLTMNKNKRYVFGIGYSTDEGVRGKFDFDWRWVNSRGHTFSSKTFVSQRKYSFDNIYRIPAENPTTDYYYFRLGASREEDKYKTTRAFAEGGYNFVVDNWSHRYALVSAIEDFTIGSDHAKVLLTYPQARVIYSSNTNRINPKSGYQIGIGGRGAVKGALSDVSFAQADLQLRALYPFNDKNAVSARADLGATWTDNFSQLPPSLRYFAGGDRSIRGYGYEQIGPRDSGGSNIGGKYKATVGLEYQYYFKPDWAAAVFVDAGDAFTHKFDTKVGAGVGVRWSSPVGPISIDIAHGLNEPNSKKVRFHINVGTELDL